MGGAGADTFVVSDTATYSDLMSGDVDAAPAYIADYNQNGKVGDGSDTIEINIALPSGLNDTIQETVQSDGHIAQDTDGNFILKEDVINPDASEMTLEDGNDCLSRGCTGGDFAEHNII
jgi:hypothetical protein